MFTGTEVFKVFDKTPVGVRKETESHLSQEDIEKVLYKYAKIFIRELPQYIKYGNQASLNAIVKYITTLTENKEFNEAIKICNNMIGFKLDDGTKSSFKGRIKRIQKKQNNT